MPAGHSNHSEKSEYATTLNYQHINLKNKIKRACLCNFKGSKKYHCMKVSVMRKKNLQHYIFTQHGKDSHLLSNKKQQKTLQDQEVSLKSLNNYLVTLNKMCDKYTSRSRKQFFQSKHPGLASGSQHFYFLQSDETKH